MDYKKSDETAEVRAILQAFLPHLTGKNIQLGAQNISNAIYGLQKMQNNSAELRAILKALLPHITNKHLQLNAQEISSILRFLHNMPNSPEVEAISQTLLSCSNEHV